MTGQVRMVVCCIVTISWLFCPSGGQAQAVSDTKQPSEVVTRAQDTSGYSNTGSSDPQKISARIYSFQSANVGTEVRGIIHTLNYKEGESVAEGAIVAEISKARYAAILGEFRSNREAIERTLGQAKEDLKVQEELYAKRATTYHELVKARAQVQVLEARGREAKFKEKQAELNYKACVIKAPFSGSIGVLYRNANEPADNLEKLFLIVDTSKVYARANWPESRLNEPEIDKLAKFTYRGKTYQGKIAKISSLIDPAAKSKYVHVLIDNPQSELQVGMMGTITLH